jgi:tetratricopeptide (TPR) repeat protein
MRAFTKFLIGALLLAAVTAPATYAKTAAELLREGLYVEEVEGDLDKAVGIYQQVIADSAAPRNLVAQALYRQGNVFLKQKREQDARAVFSQIVADYSDQTDMVAKVQPVLEELGNADPASLMPPDVIAYVEIGSPGQQVETIFKMLKDTPVEKALAGFTQNGGLEGPAAMIQKVLSPAMLGEMKKIRGIGLGVMELAQNNPTVVAVLFPGKNNTLAGLLQMGLSTLSQSSKSVDGMTVLEFGDSSRVAYDDTVIIATNATTSGEELFRQTLQRYKNKTSQPSLASGSKSFASVSKQARQQNAVTVWLNVDETYSRFMKMLPADAIPEELQAANGFINFQNVDDLIASLSLRETGVALDANVNFKDGAKSMLYNLIRTPNLNKEALKAIPGDAVALLSLTLSGADSPQAQAVGEKLREATDMDLGPQIFGHVEQITLFLTPSKETVTTQDWPMPPAIRSIGLALTGKDSSKVHQLLTTLLQMAEALPEGGEQELNIPATGRFDIAMANNLKAFGYTDPAGKTTVLSLSASVIDASMAAMKQDASVVSGGKLQDALATLPPATSKLALINVAGVIRIAAQNIPFPSEDAAAEARRAMEELAQAAEKTTLRLQTSEQDNSFGLRVSVSDLPPISKIVEPVARLVRVMEIAHAEEVGAWRGKTVSILRADSSPKIDGKPDDVWAGAPSNRIDRVAYSQPSDDTDFSAAFKTLHDSQALYLLVDVTDDRLTRDSTDFWQDDAVEVFIDAGNDKSDTYGDDDYQYHFSWDASSPSMAETKHGKTSGVQYAFAKTDAGYRLEARLPWSTLGVEPQAGTKIGLDVHVNDDDDGGDRETKLMWCTTDDIAWANPAALGTGELAGLIARWKLDEKDGRNVADSSGNGHDATVQGDPTWQPIGGKMGGAIDLGGDGDFLNVDDESAFDFAAGVTVAAWIKVRAFDRPWQALVTKGDSAWRIQRNNETNTLEFACTGLQVAGGNQYGSLFGTREIGRNEWHHVAGVFDGKRMSLYVDGTLDASQEASGTINQNDAEVQIGANTEMGDRFWNGLIDDVRIYNYGMSETQVQKLPTNN